MIGSSTIGASALAFVAQLPQELVPELMKTGIMGALLIYFIVRDERRQKQLELVYDRDDKRMKNFEISQDRTAKAIALLAIGMESSPAVRSQAREIVKEIDGKREREVE